MPKTQSWLKTGGDSHPASVVHDSRLSFSRVVKDQIIEVRFSILPPEILKTVELKWFFASHRKLSITLKVVFHAEFHSALGSLNDIPFASCEIIIKWKVDFTACHIHEENPFS